MVRYGDALMKGFATGLAIIVTTLLSVVFFDFKISAEYLCGASLVLAAILLYSNITPRGVMEAIQGFSTRGGAFVHHAIRGGWRKGHHFQHDSKHCAVKEVFADAAPAGCLVSPPAL